MINFVQKIIYKLCIVSFYVVIGMVVFLVRNFSDIDNFLTNKNIIFCSVVLLMICYHVWFLLVYVEKELPKIEIVLSKAPEEKDELKLIGFLSILVTLVTSYFSADEILKVDTVVYLIVLGIVLFVCWSNCIVVSPWCIMFRRHFHVIETASGKKLTLMSRKESYRNKRQINSVYRLFDNFVIDSK